MSTQQTEPRLVTGTRNQRYGEVLLATVTSDGVHCEVFNTYMLNDCPAELWEKLSATDIALEHGATVAILNGPRYWLMDGIGKVQNVDPVVVDFGGIAMRRAATVEIPDVTSRAPYREVTVHRGAIWFFDAGKDVHEIVTNDGRVFVMQAYCTGVNPSISLSSLASLGGSLTLPDGWSYRTRTLRDEMRVDTTGSPATVLQDEWENTYTLVR